MTNFIRGRIRSLALLRLILVITPELSLLQLSHPHGCRRHTCSCIPFQSLLHVLCIPLLQSSPSLFMSIMRMTSGTLQIKVTRSESSTSSPFTKSFKGNQAGLTQLIPDSSIFATIPCLAMPSCESVWVINNTVFSVTWQVCCAPLFKKTSYSLNWSSFF